MEIQEIQNHDSNGKSREVDFDQTNRIKSTENGAAQIRDNYGKTLYKESNYLPTVIFTKSEMRNRYDFEPAQLKDVSNCPLEKKSIDKTIEYWLNQGINATTAPIYAGLGLDMITRNRKMTATKFVLKFYANSVKTGAKVIVPKAKELLKKTLDKRNQPK